MAVEAARAPWASGWTGRLFRRWQALRSGQATAAWRRTAPRRAWLALAAALLLWAPMSASALKFQIGLHDLDEDRREPLTALVAGAEADVAGTLRTRLDGQLRIDFAGSDEAFRRLVADAGAGSQWSEPWIAGLALLSQDRVLVRLDGAGLLHTSETVRHEIAHVALHALGHGRYLPRWYHEAVAMLVAGEATAQRLLEGMTGGAAGTIDVLDDLQADFGADRLRAGRAYATAAGFLRFAIDRSGNSLALADLHERMHHGLDFEPAWIATFGLGPRELFVIYARLLESSGSRWAVWLGDTTIWTVVSLLFILALARGWRRRPDLDSGKRMDLGAIAAAGDFAMRTGRVVPPLEELPISLGLSAAGGDAPMTWQEAALSHFGRPPIEEADVEAALDARDRERQALRAAARAERTGETREPTEPAPAQQGGEGDATDPHATTQEYAGPSYGRVRSVVPRTQPPGLLRRRVDSTEGGA